MCFSSLTLFLPLNIFGKERESFLRFVIMIMSSCDVVKILLIEASENMLCMILKVWSLVYY